MGNGAWVRARPGAEVVAGLLPLGCTGPLILPRLPVPAHALEATYRGPHAAPAVALVLSLSSSASAAALVADLTAVGRGCVAPTGVVRRSDPLVAVVSEQRAGPGTVVRRRRELGAGADPWVWSEAVVRRGSRVGLLTVGVRPGDPPPSLGRLLTAVQASLGGPPSLGQ